LACATDGIVVTQDPGWIIVQLEVEAGDAVGLVTDQINGPSVERLSRQGSVRVVAPIPVDSYVVAAIVRLDRIILGPGEIIVVEIDGNAVSLDIGDRPACS
jgi:hypothetical protein